MVALRASGLAAARHPLRGGVAPRPGSDLADLDRRGHHDLSPRRTNVRKTPAGPAARRFHFEVALATLVDRAPSGDDWLHELKLDGYRIVGRLEDGAATLWSRNGKDWTAACEPVAAALGACARARRRSTARSSRSIPEGRSSFQLLQRALGGSRTPLRLLRRSTSSSSTAAICAAFPSSSARSGSQALLREVEGSGRRSASASIVSATAPSSSAARARVGAEGIVSKLAASPYRGGRRRDWLKIKCFLRQEFVIGGYTEPSGSRSHFGALLVGVFEGKRPALRRPRRDRLRRRRRSTELAAQAPRRSSVRRRAFAEPAARRRRAGRALGRAQASSREVSFAEWTGRRHRSGIRRSRDCASTRRPEP